MSSRHETGAAGERAAEEYLRSHRYTIVARNYRCKGGEIDLVALDRGTVVFVEVRTRAQGSLVHPFESVDEPKRRRIVTAARHYTTRHRLHDHLARFDLVAVHASGTELRCEHLANAFDLNDLNQYQAAPRARRRW